MISMTSRWWWMYIFVFRRNIYFIFIPFSHLCLCLKLEHVFALMRRWFIHFCSEIEVPSSLLLLPSFLPQTRECTTTLSGKHESSYVFLCRLWRIWNFCVASLRGKTEGSLLFLWWHIFKHHDTSPLQVFLSRHPLLMSSRVFQSRWWCRDDHWCLLQYLLFCSTSSASRSALVWHFVYEASGKVKVKEEERKERLSHLKEDTSYLLFFFVMFTSCFYPRICFWLFHKKQNHMGLKGICLLLFLFSFLSSFSTAFLFISLMLVL